MNDNHENKDLFEDESKREPFAKKVARFSAFIYLGLAITVVITATVGISVFPTITIRVCRRFLCPKSTLRFPKYRFLLKSRKGKNRQTIP